MILEQNNRKIIFLSLAPKLAKSLQCLLARCKLTSSEMASETDEEEEYFSSFPSKLFHMVENKKYNEIIWWTEVRQYFIFFLVVVDFVPMNVKLPTFQLRRSFESSKGCHAIIAWVKVYTLFLVLQNGDGFFICEDSEFVTSKILNKYTFKTNSYGSFIRQLNNCKYNPCNFRSLTSWALCGVVGWGGGALNGSFGWVVLLRPSKRAKGRKGGSQGKRGGSWDGRRSGSACSPRYLV